MTARSKELTQHKKTAAVSEREKDSKLNDGAGKNYFK